ncbi:hypothetical protein [Micromonospora kangleipakensis]|uniref:hypothetical protein n=1 Tax=Micromonospora kangleipakensis TaxID=1077942 RepID=UPI00102A120B|nr:hypothetical protein [Micromonospora kangleipakensis]
MLLGISAAVGLAGTSPARASVVPTPTLDGPTWPALSGLPNANRPEPAGTPRSSSISASGYAKVNPGNVLILGGIGDLFDGGQDDDEGATAPPESPAAPSPGPPATELASPRPQFPALDSANPNATPTAVEAGKPLPLIPADPGQPVVAETLSTVTASTVTMTGLRIRGIVDLPTTGGTLRTLKFSMDRAITDDFLLRAPGPAGRTMRFATDRLTLTGEVAVYATRFVGRLLGVTITLTPDLPFPDGIPSTSPITISDPAIDLAFMNSHSLTARPALKLTLD